MKRILFVGEASFLATGFATYYRELLSRLAATGKYDIGELGSYARSDDPRVKEFINNRWKFWGAMPSNQQEAQIFGSWPRHPRNPQGSQGGCAQFGEWIFDQVCAEFQPDIVIDIRDWWMLEFQERSVFRDWFKWIIMPTIDAEPQHEDWIRTYENADLNLTYSDFGIHVIKRQSVTAKVFPKPMRPGVDLDTFKPIRDKKKIREHFLLKPDVPVIGTVMRNQARKLYPDLIDAFARMKIKYKGERAVDKAVLLIHSAWPDNVYSYDYPRHITRLQAFKDWMENGYKGIIHDVLQTLKCHSCDKTSYGFAQVLHGRPVEDGRIKLACPQCGEVNASPPGTGGGFTREELAQVYNSMDLYVQCSICEGDGMPIQEAKACGVPTLVVNYSAMAEKGRFPKEYNHLKGVTPSDYTCTLGGNIIEVGRHYYEPETSCRRALPDIEDLADKMMEFITDDQYRGEMSEDARRCVEENYDWEKLWKQWEYVLDNVKSKDRSKTWDSPIEQVVPSQTPPIPENLNDTQFIEWLYLEILKYPSVDPTGAEMWQNHLLQGVSRDRLLQQFLQISQDQSGFNTKRQQIRAAVAGIQTNATVPQEWI